MISDIRKNNNLTQFELAEKLRVSQQTVSHWETGAREPPLEKLLLMSELFGCTLDELVKGEKNVIQT